MNEDILQGQWKQVKGQIRAWWGQLSKDDVETIGGKTEKLLGLLQEKYGYSRERAEEEMKRRLRDFENEHSAVMTK